MAELPTVRVRNWKPGARSIGIINVRDFDPKVHERVEDEEAAEESAAVDTELKAPQRRRKAYGG